MRIKVLGANMTALEIGEDEIFFSYNTPVAGHIGGQFCRTSKKWSMTTSRHINKYLGDAKNSAEEKDQSFFDQYIGGAK
jgi:hypothetical protein